MSDTSELIAQQILNASINKKNWGQVLYNVKVFGAKGDGVYDDTQAVQDAIDTAIFNDATLVYFPPGSYKVTSLSNTSTIHFIGDNATFVGYSGTINQFGTSNGEINVRDYGATGDGVTDDTAAIQEAITAASGTGSVVFFPSTTANVYKISSTLTNVTGELIILQGQGSMPNPNNVNNAEYTPATKILWAGSASPMLKITGPIGSCSIKGITFDGNGVATYGINLDTVQFSDFYDVGINNVTTVGLWLNTIAQQGGSDPNVNTMFNTFNKIAVANCPVGIMLDGNSVNGSNTCHNTFENVKTDYTGTAGVHYVRSDNNTMTEVYTFQQSGAGYGVQIEPNSYSEYIYHLQGTANGVSGNGGLMIFGYDKANGQPDPTGSNISYTQTGLNASKWSLKQPIETPSIDGVITAIKGKTLERSFVTTSTMAATATSTLSPAGAPSTITTIVMPVDHYPIGMSVSLSSFITTGSFTVNVNANGTPVWSKTITHPSGNNQFFQFSQNNSGYVPAQQGLSVTIVTTGIAPTTLNALVSLIFAI